MSRHLIARIRHVHAAGGDGLNLDWRRSDAPGEANAPNGGWRAQLENGDHAHVYSVGGDKKRWGYVLFGPKTEHDGDPNVPDGPTTHLRSWGDPEGVYSQLLGTASSRHGGVRFLPDPHSAMREAEEHYFGLGRRGQAPASDLDYEALVNPRDDLDDDFGHIFGDRS